MPKKIAAILLAVILLIALIPASVFADDITFIAVNDTLLELTSMPAFVGAKIYVPARVFENFGIYSSYFSSDSTAMIYTGAKQLIFEMTSGNTYDQDGNYFSEQAVLRNGQVYLPVGFICSQFGLSYSYIPGTGHGNIVRIVNGSAVLSDERFIYAASVLMDNNYNAYMGVTPAPEDGKQQPAAPEIEPDRSDTDVLLSFSGMPSGEFLDLLKRHSAQACFFLTADEILASPDLTRRIAGSGCRIGVLCTADPAAEYAEAAEYLFDAAREIPYMIAADTPELEESCRAFAAQQALAFLSADIDAADGVSSPAVITSQIEFSIDRVSVRMRCGAETETVMRDVLLYLKQNQFGIRALCETDVA